MNLKHKQQLLIQGATVAGACAMAWTLVVRPSQTHVTQLRDEVRAMESHLQSAPPVAEAVSEQRLTRLAADAAQLDEISAKASDESRLYADLNRLAREFNVRLDSVQSGKAPRGSKPLPGKVSVNTVAFDVGVVGSYNDIVRFLHVIETEMGTSIVSGVQLARSGSTADDAEFVAANIQTVHYALGLTVAMGGAQSEDQQP